jgi:hypothetical protein
MNMTQRVVSIVRMRLNPYSSIAMALSSSSSTLRVGNIALILKESSRYALEMLKLPRRERQ